LISDIRLPDGSGLDLIRRLQSNRPIRGIAISGFGTEQDQRRSREAGYETHLTKPVDFDRLLEAIETLPPRPVG
jgi:CheY-like chemotaxis protein